MSRYEYRVSYRREANKQVQEKVFRQMPALRRFLNSLSDPDRQVATGRILPVVGFAIDRREVGRWERIDERGELLG